jgi:hypothetical protein
MKGLLGLFEGYRQAQDVARTAFLAEHPNYIACAVQGCPGLVGPAYQRLNTDGTKWGVCPRRSTHTRLMPELFPSPASTAAASA